MPFRLSTVSSPVLQGSQPPAVAQKRALAAVPVPPTTLESLHPAVWRGHQLGRQLDRTVATGFADLDAQLPGGGWPQRVITELLLAQPGIGEMRLLARSLVQVQQAGRLVMLFDPPAQLSAWALGALGLDVAQCLVVHTRVQPVPGTDPLWALEQSLKSGHVGAVLAWLPAGLKPERLRRLQLAAHAHDGPAFVVREGAAQQQPSAAPLRLALRPGGIDQLALQVLKRCGPPLRRPVHLRLPSVLSDTARGRAVAPPHVGDEGLNDDGAPALRPLGGATFINLAPSAASAAFGPPGHR